jgi:hypothetical protein
MNEAAFIPKPLVPIVVDEPKPRKEREKKTRSQDVLKRAVKLYNEKAKWASFHNLPRFSEEERVLLKELFAKFMAGETTEYSAVKKFCEIFPARTFRSIRWRMRRLRGKT